MQHGACFYGGATNKTSAMFRHRQQFQRDEKCQPKNLIFNNKTKPGGGLGLDIQ